MPFFGDEETANGNIKFTIHSTRYYFESKKINNNIEERIK